MEYIYRDSRLLIVWISYILNQAVKLTFLGPLGMARWNIEACMEIVRRCEDLYLLIDKKIERTTQVIHRLETASASAVEAFERLDVLRDMLGKQVEKLSKAKKERLRAEALAREQRDQRIRSIHMRSFNMRSVELEAFGRKGGFETPSKPAKRIKTSVMGHCLDDERGGQ